MKILDYIEMKEKIVKQIELQKNIVLATSTNNQVTARTVYCASNGLKVYFMTSKAYTKYKQIEKNPLVAMCFNNVQIQGKAAVLGHPLDDNKKILDCCNNVTSEFMYWSKYKNTVLIEVTISEVECWNNNGREYLDVINKKAYRVG